MNNCVTQMSGGGPIFFSKFFTQSTTYATKGQRGGKLNLGFVRGEKGLFVIRPAILFFPYLGYFKPIFFSFFF